jgi:hypothetical protein
VWSPNVINTSIQGITNYTFTAANSSLCVLPFNLPVEILPTVIPEFDFKRDYCQNESPEILSSISKNNIDGVWSPSTINTMIPGKYTFTFTPSQIHKCTKSINEAIDVQPEIYPQFIIPDSICFNSQELLLPSLSQNNVAGIWSPLKVTTTTAGNYLFNFTSDKTANKCNRDVSKNITVLKPISLKTLPPFCDPSLIYYEQTFEVSGSSEKFGQITSTFGVVEWIGPNTFKIKQIPSESNLSIQIKDNFGCVITESIPKHKCNCPNTLPFANHTVKEQRYLK